jgi:hypothetical protein
MSTKQNYVLVAAATIVALSAMLALVPAQTVFAACTGNPHDHDSGPTGNPHDNGEGGNPHDSGGRHGGEGENCHGTQ